MSRLHQLTVPLRPVPGAGLIGLWRERARIRRRLGELDGHLLEDIGMTPSRRDAEVLKPFWRA